MHASDSIKKYMNAHFKEDAKPYDWVARRIISECPGVDLTYRDIPAPAGRENTIGFMAKRSGLTFGFVVKISFDPKRDASESNEDFDLNNDPHKHEIVAAIIEAINHE